MALPLYGNKVKDRKQIKSMSLAAQLKKQKQAVAERNAGRQNAYKWKLASTEVRILPSWREATEEELESGEGAPISHAFGQSWIKDFDGQLLAVVGDRKITYGEDCAVRNLIFKAQAASRSDGQRKHYKEMLASSRQLVNGLVLNDPDVDPTEPQILDFSEAQWTGPVGDLIIAAAEEGDDVLSLENGFNLTVTKSGKGMETKYGFTLARRPSKVDPKVLEKLHDLDTFVKAKFADGERATNAIKSLMGEPVALIDRSTDLIEDRRSTRNEDVTEAQYDVIDDAAAGGVAVEVENVAVSDADIDALFD
jgi:hypothetical protein